MSNLQPHCCLKIDFQKADQHAGGKCLIHDTNDGGVPIFVKNDIIVIHEMTSQFGAIVQNQFLSGLTKIQQPMVRMPF